MKTKINNLKVAWNNTQEEQDRVMKFLIKQFQKFKVLSQMHEKILQKKKQDKRLVEKKIRKKMAHSEENCKNLQDVADG